MKQSHLVSVTAPPARRGHRKKTHTHAHTHTRKRNQKKSVIFFLFCCRCVASSPREYTHLSFSLSLSLSLSHPHAFVSAAFGLILPRSLCYSRKPVLSHKEWNWALCSAPLNPFSVCVLVRNCSLVGFFLTLFQKNATTTTKALPSTRCKPSFILHPCVVLRRPRKGKW